MKSCWSQKAHVLLHSNLSTVVIFVLTSGPKGKPYARLCVLQSHTHIFLANVQSTGIFCYCHVIGVDPLAFVLPFSTILILKNADRS